MNIFNGKTIINYDDHYKEKYCYDNIYKKTFFYLIFMINY